MNNIDLKETWLKATIQYSDSESEWTKIEAAYSASGRHYHTLQHLAELHGELRNHFGDAIPMSSLFALFYHDVVYNTLLGDNEKQSAEWAREKLTSWNVDTTIVQKCYDIILATASHQSEDEETMIFLDADMAILGADENRYKDYREKVRKEFSIYPDLLYNRGRRKFIETTLKRKSVFLTTAFLEKYEAQSRINLSHELNLLK